MRKTSKDFDLTKGMTWLVRHLEGETISHIAKTDRHGRDTVKKHMKKASGVVIDLAQEKILEKIFPLALRALEVNLTKVIEAGEAGKTMDMTWVEKVLKGMYILDAPQLKQMLQVVPPEEDSTLLQLMGNRVQAKLLPLTPTTLEGEMKEDGDKDFGEPEASSGGSSI